MSLPHSTKPRVSALTPTATCNITAPPSTNIGRELPLRRSGHFHFQTPVLLPYAECMVKKEVF